MDVFECVGVFACASTCIYMSDGEKVNIQTDRSFGFCTAIMLKTQIFYGRVCIIELNVDDYEGQCGDKHSYTSIQTSKRSPCSLSECVSSSSQILFLSHDLSLTLFFILCRIACIHKFCKLSKQSRQNKGMIRACMCVYIVESAQEKRNNRESKKQSRTK